MSVRTIAVPTAAEAKQYLVGSIERLFLDVVLAISENRDPCLPLVGKPRWRDVGVYNGRIALSAHYTV